MIKRDDYAIYTSLESDGLDLVIKDNCDRYSLIPVCELEQFITDVVHYYLNSGEDSVRTRFKELDNE